MGKDSRIARRFINLRSLLVFSVSTLSIICSIDSAFAQAAKADEPGEAQTTDIVILGSRKADRTALDSPVPVDSFDAQALQTSTGTGDLNVGLKNLVPSLNQPEQSSSDGSASVRPIILRGLSPDQTLVLVNGKRYHRSALVNLAFGAGSLVQGSQAPDVSNIPAIGLRGLEVLRDGASAQYGSDAIAGVVNLSLRQDTKGLEIVGQYGQYYKGEYDYQVSANYGTKLTDAGFFNISAQYNKSEATSRGVQRADAQALIDAGNTAVPVPAQVWGRPAIEALRLLWNGGLSVSDNADVYFFGNYSHTDTNSGFFYRHPTTNAVFSTVPLDFNNPASGGTFNFRSWFPGGYSPRFMARISDFSQVIGLRGKLDMGLGYDLSGSYGRNEINYFINNTVNASLGPNSPKEFAPGSLVQTEKNLNADFTYQISDGIFFAFGGEYRVEGYEIRAGDPASYEVGPYALIVDSRGNPVINPSRGVAYAGLPIGSDGFPGYSPSQAGQFDRSNFAIYGDVELTPTDKLLIDAAGRFEKFSDFGTTVNGKLAFRYELTKAIAVRGAISTGFRAPTPGQANTTNASVRFFPPALEPQSVGIIPATNPIAQYFGGKQLQPEKSVNLTGGIVLQLAPGLNVTADYYRIDVNDRIGLSSAITISNTDRAALVAAGVTGASDFGRIQFFTNAFDTRTQGVDIVAEYALNWSLGKTSINVGYNYNDTAVRSYDPSVIDRKRRLELQGALPAHRLNVTVDHKASKWGGFVRANYYSSVLEASASNPALDQVAGAEVVVDMELSAYINDRMTLSVGAQNLFDNYPDKNTTLLGAGLPYFRQSPIGYQGGLWYARAKYSF
ncbi:TonB-dependent receptor [Sphingobium sp. H39-3-25]|uniref:TonB-dependent receptor plug domain-containing protein n=1 Tax=Sphingobium arseniciresistens TaxID=3030834 RepID=UPI0023B9B923|nr:TonB-dependent receptor [Sphingobium arseniciresistens]